MGGNAVGQEEGMKNAASEELKTEAPMGALTYSAVTSLSQWDASLVVVIRH